VEDAILFQEEQRFRQPWLWVILGGSTLLTLGLLGFGAVQQLVFGRPWGDRPMPDGALIATLLTTLLIQVGPIWLCWNACLRTEIRSCGISVRFFPFHLKAQEIPFSRVHRWEVVRYHPLRDYGGWGLRIGPRGVAYNVSGNRGVLLELSGGKRLLIGTQHPDKLERILNEIAPLWEK
jgi:hypothetical protein